MANTRKFKSALPEAKSKALWWKTKSPFYWIRLSTLSAATLTLAYMSVVNAIGSISRRQNPALTLSVVPSEPVALTFVADRQFLVSQTADSLNTVESMARRALRQQPLNASAVRLLGYVDDARGQKDTARELLASAAGLSRREFGAQLWLIEDAAARDDVSGALRHYDIALRTTDNSHAVLVPTLTGALNDPRVREGMAPYVRQGADWVPVFLADAIANSSNPANVADIMVRAGRLPSNEQYRQIANGLLSKLAEKNMFASFRQLYRTLPGSRPAAFTSVALNTDTVSLPHPAAGWSMSEHPAAGARFSEPADSGAITANVFAGSGERQELMRKYSFFKPGRYHFSAGYDAEQTATDAQIQWDFLCMSPTGNRTLWQVIAPVIKGRRLSERTFTVPPNCPNQQLAFGIAGGTDQTGAELVLRSMSITPI